MNVCEYGTVVGGAKTIWKLGQGHNIVMFLFGCACMCKTGLFSRQNTGSYPHDRRQCLWLADYPVIGLMPTYQQLLIRKM